jgi:pimeloyl-ACP methyl ester carboxylesterase
MSHSETDELEHLRLATELSQLDVRELCLPQGHEVVLRGMRFHYLDWGQEGRPVVLFLHGGALTAHTWDLVCLALRDKYHCLALDQRGHGDSEWSPTMEYGWDSHLRDIEAFADRMRLDGFVLVGQSMGAMNSIAYASRHSDRLAALALIDAGPRVQRQGAKRIVDFVTMPAELDSIDEFVERARTFNPLRDPRLLKRSLLHNLRRLPSGKWTWKYDRRQMSRERFQVLLEHLEELRSEIPSIRCPTLVVRGGSSDIFSDEDAASLASLLPEGQWVRVEGAGHTVQGDNPKGLVEALQRFLGQVGLCDHGHARSERLRLG